MWDGELHIVPPPSDRHRAVGGELFLVPAGIAKARGLVAEPETRRVELFANRDGRMVPVAPVIVECLGVRAETVGGALRLTWDGGTADI